MYDIKSAINALNAGALDPEETQRLAREAKRLTPKNRKALGIPDWFATIAVSPKNTTLANDPCSETEQRDACWKRVEAAYESRQASNLELMAATLDLRATFKDRDDSGNGFNAYVKEKAAGTKFSPRHIQNALKAAQYCEAHVPNWRTETDMPEMYLIARLGYAADALDDKERKVHHLKLWSKVEAAGCFSSALEAAVKDAKDRKKKNDEERKRQATAAKKGKDNHDSNATGGPAPIRVELEPPTITKKEANKLAGVEVLTILLTDSAEAIGNRIKALAMASGKNHGEALIKW